MNIYTRNDQILFIPTFGLAIDYNGNVWFSIAFLNFGITFKILSYGTESD